MRTFKRPGLSGPRITASTVALALLVAACGAGDSGETTIEQAATEQAEAQESAESTDGAAEPATDESAEQAENNDDGTEAEEAGPEVPAAHLFPDLQTVRVTDGETINLADELAGGDTPILLWFYAPH